MPPAGLAHHGRLVEFLDHMEPWGSLLLALSAGLLVGLERERARPDDTGSRKFFGGVRTYPIFSLLGAVATLLVPALGPWPFVLATAGALAFVMTSYRSEVALGHHGLTSEGAFLVVYLLGALSASRGTIEPFQKRALVVAAVAVVVTMLLSAKPSLHRLSQRLKAEDVIALLKLLLVGVVVLPLLPDTDLGPYGVLNPFRVGKMVALIAGIGFVGWAAMRLLGPGRGMVVTGAVGGLVSSTAVTLAAAARAKQNPALGPVAALAAILASTLMVGRVVAAIAVVNPALLPAALPPLLAMAAGGVGWTLVLYRRSGQAQQDAAFELENPFELGTALKFAALYVLVLLVARAGLAWFGDRGAYATGVLAGTTDVDAITLSMASLARDGHLLPGVAVTTIFLATISNSVVKAGMAVVVGGAAWGRRVAVALATMLGLGVVTLILTAWRG